MKHFLQFSKFSEHFPTSFWQESVDSSTNYDVIFNPSPTVYVFIQIPKITVFPQKFKLFYIPPFLKFFSSRDVQSKRLCSVSVISRSLNPLSPKNKQYFISLKNNNTLSHSPFEQLGTGLICFCGFIRAAVFEK